MLYGLGEAINNIIDNNSKPRLVSLAEQFEEFKINPPDTLPPVGCNLVIIVDGHELTAKRTGYIANRGIF